MGLRLFSSSLCSLEETRSSLLSTGKSHFIQALGARPHLLTPPPCIVSSSGPTTHARVEEQKPTITAYGPRVSHTDKFMCEGGVDAAKLLTLSRKELYSMAKRMGGNILVREEWTCKISRPRFRKSSCYKVTVKYTAQVARSIATDPQKPVSPETAKGMKGLMVVLDRQPD